MSFNWAQLCDLAQELAGQTPVTPAGQEARLRCAISRAYYAAFITARNHARDRLGQTFALNKAHSSLPDVLMASTDDTLKKVGSDLVRLRSARDKADYDDAIDKLESLASVGILLSRQILSGLSSL